MAATSVTSASRCSSVAPQQSSQSVAEKTKTCEVDERYSSSFDSATPDGPGTQPAPIEGTPTAKAFIRLLETQIAAAELVLAQGDLPAPMRQQVQGQLAEAKQKLAEVRQQSNQEMPPVTLRDRAEQLKKQSLTLKTYDETIDTTSFNNVGFTRERTSKNTERLNTPDGSEIWVSSADRQYINAAINIEGKAIDLYLEGEKGLTTEQALQWTKDRDQAAQAEVRSDAQKIVSGSNAVATALSGPRNQQAGPTTAKEKHQ